LIRSARPEDVGVILELVHDLAHDEGADDEVSVDEA
jgi:N-acetylglutamate synthase-like GNAT family acetyltransferase